ncbi:MAG: imidazoleglycerol-phosphate dehydratase HisB [Dehalococcoidia bacterium]|nr:imidazoleglycerol-phosphate dehydratase HisB [Dehalococcoidia bacterium]
MSAERTASVVRTTKETTISVELAIDGSGAGQMATGVGMLDHLLDQIARHGLFNLTVTATGDLHIDAHHTVEDVAIVLGQAFDRALGDRAGIVRTGHAIVPLDETLALVAVDLSGRGYSVIEMPFTTPVLGTLPTELIPHFLESFARESRSNLHVQIVRAGNSHHVAESVFKALARALDAACRIDPRRSGSIPSTKGSL